MGFWDVVNDIGEAIEDGVEAVVEGVGQVADDALDLLSDGAKAIGLDGIAEGLDDLGDNIASGTGGDVEEEELGATEDPKELIRGEPTEISSTAQTLQKMATAIDSTGQALKQIDAAEWVGEGADAFNAVYDKQPKLWFDCADAFTSAAKAMEAWHNEVKTGQGKAADAIDKWKAADAEERRQKNWWNSLTGEQQAQTTLVDTWTSMRNEAREILRGARTQRDNGASIAVGAFSAATDKAPKEPPFTDRWIANISDLGGVLEHGALNFTSGLLTSFTGLVQFVRQVNPTDIYNMTHPAEYAAGLSDLATGLVVAVADPGATVSAILSDARKNPFEFMGALTGDALLTAATGGGGSAKVAVSALRKMKDAGRLARVADDVGDVGRHLPNSPHTLSGTPSHMSMETSQHPAPTRVDNAHTPTNTNPVQANSRPEAPAPKHENVGGTHHSASDPPHRPEPAASGPTHRAPDPAPTRHTDPDPAPSSHADPSPTSHTDPSPTPNQHADPSPDRSTVTHRDPDPAPSPHTNADPTPTARPDGDPPPHRTDPRPEALRPTTHADTPPTVHVDPERAPHSRTDVDSPSPHADSDAPQAHPETRSPHTDAAPNTHASPDTTRTPHNDTAPGVNSDATPDTRASLDSTRSPQTSSEASPDTRANPDYQRSPQANSEAAPHVRTDPGHTSTTNPDDGPPARSDTGATPTHQADPTSVRPHTPDPQPGPARQPDPAPVWQTSPWSHPDPPAPYTRPDPAPGVRAQPDPTRAYSDLTPSSRPEPGTRTQPDRTPAARAQPDPATRPYADPKPVARPHRDPTPTGRAEPRPSPTTRPAPDHAPQRAHAEPTARPHSETPSRHADSHDTNRPTPHQDPHRSPDSTDRHDRPRGPEDAPRDRRPDLDHPRDRHPDREPTRDREHDLDDKPRDRHPNDRPRTHDDTPRDRDHNHDRRHRPDNSPHDRDRTDNRDRPHDSETTPRDRHPDRDHERTRDREHGNDRPRDHDETPRDRHTDRMDTHDRPHDPDADHPARERAEADRNAHEHARAAGPEADRTPAQKTCSTDPVDISTGEFLLPDTDLDLPGVLPLTLQRAHHSNFGFGRWFGPSWSSTLDARIVVEDAGVTFIGENAMMLAYPHAEVGVPVHPLTEGQQWSLTRTEAGGYRVWDQRAEVLWHFAPELGLDGIEARFGNYAISAITDRHRNRIRFHYDADGVPVEVTHSGGYRVRIDSDGARITGLSLLSDDPELGESAAPVLEFAYAGTDLAAVTDADGATTRYSYDAEHRMTSWTDSNGNQMVNTYDESGRVVFQRGTAGILNCDYDYLELPDGTGRLTMVTDSLGATTSHGFDRELQLRDLVDPIGGRTHIDYNADRRPLTVTGPDGATTRYHYNGAGDCAKVVRPDGHSTEVEYLWRNRPLTITSPDGSVTHREWSEHGNLSAVVDAMGSRTEFTYHPNGALASVVEANGARTTFQVDQAGLLTQVTEPHGAVTHIRRDAAGRTTHIIDPLGEVTRFDWSAAGKLLRRTDPDGRSESWTYDGEGNIRSRTDRAGAVTRLVYGDFDLLRSRTDPDGSTTRYTWDTERRLVAVHNPIGQSWAYEYDSAGRLVAETAYSGATTRYAYDRAGRVSAITPATGATRHQHHDVLGRLTEISAGDEWIRYTHDPAGRVLAAVNGVGADLTHRLEFGYTAIGAVVSEKLDANPPMLFEHDRRGHRTRRTTPSGAVATWHHDVTGRLDHLNADDHDITFDYDPLGRLTTWRVGEVAVTRGLTALGRVTHQEVTAFPPRSLSLEAGPSARPDPTRLRRDEFAYRPDGYLLSHTIDRPQTNPLRRDYQLDPAGRVTTVTIDGAPTERYTYDALDNVTSATVAAPIAGGEPGFPPDNGRREYRGALLVRDGRTRYHYDAAGRLIRKTTVRLSRKPDVWHYRYNAFDQLTDAWTPDRQWWHYTYDALGRRTTKQHLATDGTVLERVDYLWDGTHLIEQSSGTATVRWQYQPGSHTPLTQSTDQGTVDREFYAIVADLVGAPAELVDPATADTVADAHTDLWGRTTWRGRTGSPLRFPGQIHDPETGLHYNMFRYYNPDTGQYLTPDPLGLDPAPNPYAYTSNPLRFIDPLGLTPTACERFANFYRQVTPKELQRAPAPYPGGRIGHALQKHGVTPEVQASILNNPQRIFSGDYHGKHHVTKEPYIRPVDVYYSKGSIVVTEAGNKNSVITAYGLIDKNEKKPKALKPEKWAESEHYVEITRNNGAHEVVYPTRESWEGNSWQ
ncbi:hypothetical protein NBRGN_080_00320 [Nocardia brasiliensis NBRC 14402]|uniref:putative T7SS-secreted protein n=1 Tax=Nocardia brasiliensis TaxID=37326 RepID=UPI0003022C8E|nr:RHS repeat-associated core domain-containing protein [Nocardia brasiliensis]ASF07181.1 hypothetical protein CEQ30_07250 [Nocardia brasiliensis]GAJ84908.1 hypothetical protein NBRGN_080_00320 [Nocardia brasiliensis NBRC 14402]SUB47547.1 Cell wall-associated polypeptide CWBP200 [Nocardia brasiliensis]